MRALIAGITGQDGSYLAEFLLSKGREVHGTIRPSSTFTTNRIDHLYLDPSRAHGVAKFVQIGAVCSYPKCTAVPFFETELRNGYQEETNAPYLWDRQASPAGDAARVPNSIRLQSYLPASSQSLRAGRQFDPQTSHVIPALIRKFVDGADARASSVTLWGSGSASREFLHVGDAARGSGDAALACNEPEPVNLGTGSEITIACSRRPRVGPHRLLGRHPVGRHEA